MAIVKCRNCHAEIEETIARCPHCRALGPKRSRRIRWMLLGVMALVVVLFGVGYYRQMHQVEKPYEMVLQERLDEKLSQRGTAAALLLRSRLDRPASMRLELAKANQDGSVLCFAFTEQGGSDTVRRQSSAVFVDGELDRTPQAWELFCQDPAMRPIVVNLPAL